MMTPIIQDCLIFERVIEGPPSSYPWGDNTFEPSQLLVEYHGVLLRVCREAHFKKSYVCETRGNCMMVLDVNVLVFEVEMKSVGDDMALFMGRGCSRSVCVSQYKPWGNSIFFLDDGTWNWFWKEEQWSCCMYSMRDDDFLSPPEAAWMNEKVPGAWLFPQL